MKEFQISYGLQYLPQGAQVTYRTAAKAVVKRGEEILLIRTNKGDYKFPGGGYRPGEDIEECLVRELLEETGYQITVVKERIGAVIEQNVDKFEPDKFFSMKSEYFCAEIDEHSQKEQNLDEYEKEQDFCPVFVGIEEAVKMNQKILNDTNREKNSWVKRETDVLEWLSQNWIGEGNE